MSATRSDGPAKGGRYHHGDLRAALVDAAVALVVERGVRGFSMAEASRRVGVTSAAAYRHFADRDELVAAVAVRALEVFVTMLRAEARDADEPAERLAAIARAYVRFAAEHQALFDTLYSSGIDKHRYPELKRAWEPIDALLGVVQEICEGDAASAKALAAAVEAAAYGHAALFIMGEYGQGRDAVRTAVNAADGATLALIEGREALFRRAAS